MDKHAGSFRLGTKSGFQTGHEVLLVSSSGKLATGTVRRTVGERNNSKVKMGRLIVVELKEWPSGPEQVELPETNPSDPLGDAVRGL